ncbi:hypothetical protein SD427_18840 (plasmid) [Chryseobacterium sp. JJR-5R]|uniref:hypothetical protein n=1 Tax=Chryseobacterium sp. JJR-5R TaxID=3093923 RepID=UPI002A75DF15|nr:hypothetical protein [Chryseobacterium sp. JJR-5R]WPO84657.1 hypothetical protein SD427_18840 [Chryseobacterium sp. JJR-5R]
MKSKNGTLPTDDLKKYGIIEADNSFSKKLTADDIQKFLQGFVIVADNDKRRVTFQLTGNNSQLDVNLYERDKNLSDILVNSKNGIEYSGIQNISPDGKYKEFEKKAFIYDALLKVTKEYDFIKDAAEITKMVAETKNADQIQRYKYELQQLKSFLKDKVEEYPEIAKEISVDINIVSKELSSIESILPTEDKKFKNGKEDIQLNVNDPDLYQDANRERQEEFEQEQEEEQEAERPRGFRR